MAPLNRNQPTRGMHIYYSIGLAVDDRSDDGGA